jgi:ectoine hydroxylase
MQLTSEHLKTYADQGYLFFTNCFSKTEIERLKSELPSIYKKKDTPGRIIESDGQNVRMVFGSHTSNEVFRCLAHHPRLVKPVMQILGTSVYIHQHSINAKVALEGDVFRWHQDSTYHKEQDGILRSNLVVSMVFLDEVNEFNGPLMIIPGSHKELIMNDWGTDFLIKRRRLIFPTI